MDWLWVADVTQMIDHGPDVFLNTNTLQKYTNKKFLIDDHEKTLQSITKFECKATKFQQTATFARKPSAPVTLNRNNCVDIKTITGSINQPLTGKFLLCRSICPAFKMTAVGAVVDDPEGQLVVRLALYNFIQQAFCSLKDLEMELPVGTVLAIKNPWFKTTADHGLTVRCDNPADVVILNESTLSELFPKLIWNGEIPKKYQQPELAAPDGCLDWNRIGNEHFVFKRYKDAISAYTNGLKKRQTSENQVELLANRSAAYLGLSQYNLALIDAESALAIDKWHLKCISRKTKALIGMALYTIAFNFLNEISIPEIPQKNRKIIIDLLAKVKMFIAQSQYGDYAWKELSRMSFENLDLAEFKGPVVVKKTTLKGRGLFAKETIKAGQLILVSKAFAFVVDTDPNEIIMSVNTRTKVTEDKTQVQLVSNIAHILQDNPEKCVEVYSLYAGPELGFIDYGEGVKHDHVVDMERIDAICNYNTFGIRLLKDTGIGFNSSGLWITPSFINHSCVDSNSSWRQVGNFIFVRAFYDIPEGQEILISYIVPTELISQTKLDKYGFICDCRLCSRDRIDSTEIQADRAFLFSRLETILKKYKKERAANFQIFDPKEDAIEIKDVLEAFNKTRKDAPELNLCLFDILVGLCGHFYYENKYFLESASTLVNLFEVIENIPVFSVVSAQICVNIIGASLPAGNISMAQSWLDILKRRTTLVYGTWDAIYTLFPSTVALMKEYAFDI